MKITKVLFVTCLLVGLLVGPAPAAFAISPQASIPPNIILTPVLSGLNQPLFATHAGDGSGRLFIVQRGGKIRIFDGNALNATPFLDVGSIIKTTGGEQGLLGLAFDPNYATNGYFYITYTDQSAGSEVLARYHVSGDPDVADDTSAQILLTVPEPEANHNGGMIAFGPDGYLYFGLGDGGGGGDNHGTIGNGQDTTTLLGKILRLDVSTVPYTIPPTNPFYGSATDQEEIWAYGLRNPWRFSFDKTTGDLYIGDVGQGTQEEVDYQPAAFAGGANYGWRIREGNLCYNPSSGCVSPPDYVAPVATYNHDVGCSVTGGYVYRGSAFPGLVGVYLFGDYCSGNLWGLVRNASNQWVKTLIKSTGYNISSFAEDEQGELYIVDYGGQLIHIAETPVLTTTFISSAALDGYIVETSESSGLGGYTNATRNLLLVGDNAQDRQIRAILSFNTGSLPDNAVITSAKLKLKKYSFTGASPFGALGVLVADIRKPMFGDKPGLQPKDFQAAAGCAACAKFQNIPVNSWYSATLNNAGLSQINLLGNTQFRLRFTKDDNDNQTHNRVNFLSGNAGGSKPKLIISYYIP